MKKTTTLYKMETHRVPKAVGTRKQWRKNKFGDAASDKEGPNPATTQIADEVFLTLTTNRESLEQPDDELVKKLAGQQRMVSCRYCKGDHWTLKCPYKDTLQRTEEASGGGVQAEPASGAGSGSGGVGTKYVPPNQRDRGDRGTTKGELMDSRGQADDQATVRVTNLSEEAQEADLRELFGHFGMLKRIFLAKDKQTQQSKGFAFISYNSKTSAQKAIDTLNGHGYDHLILKVEWAKPSRGH
ncbi:hypothetical protein EMCRGX_G020109 [Ephydatia muelleri]